VVGEMPADELVSVQKDRERRVKPIPSRAAESETVKPLPFLVRNSKPKRNIREDRTSNILNRVLRRTRRG